MQRWLESYSYDVVVSSLLARLQDAWVCWNCDGREDVSLVRDLSLGELFLDMRLRRVVGSPMKLDFLVREGQVTCARSAHKQFFLGSDTGPKSAATAQGLTGAKVAEFLGKQLRVCFASRARMPHPTLLEELVL